MATTPTPFDDIAASGTSPQGSSAPETTPFDDVLPSEKTQPNQQAASPASNFTSGSKVPNTILNGSDTAGDIIGGLTLGGGAALAASPIVDAAISHLGGLTKIVQAAKAMGWTTFGIKEAHDLYKMVVGDNKK